MLLLAFTLPWLPLQHNPNQLDLANIFQPPFQDLGNAGWHFLGTDSLGRDVLSNVLYGIRTAFFISLPIMLLATLIGVLLGAAAGYFGEKGLKTTRANLLLLPVSVICIGYYGLYLPLHLMEAAFEKRVIGESILAGCLLLMLLFTVFKILHRFIPVMRQKVAIPVDQIVLRLIESLSTIPRFVLILVLASYTPPSVSLLSIIIILTIWTNTARLARAEMRRIKQLPYFEAAKSIGLRPRQLIWRQAMPNLLGPVLVSFTFGLGSLLALESTLSFLNIGIPTDFVSWGRTIANVRSNTSAWWLVVFPGLVLTLTILALYTCSHYLAAVFHRNDNA
ncbi:ABC transporter permease [Pontibacter sp. CAU 1760]